jgi:anti-sigma B factor antagonist
MTPEADHDPEERGHPRDEDGRSEVTDVVEFSATIVDGSPQVVRLSGELDLATVPVLVAALDRVPADVVLDCTNLGFVDSSGLSAIVADHRRRTGSGHRLTLRGMSATVRQTFELTGLHRELAIEPVEPG